MPFSGTNSSLLLLQMTPSGINSSLLSLQMTGSSYCCCRQYLLPVATDNNGKRYEEAGLEMEQPTHRGRIEM